MRADEGGALRDMRLAALEESPAAFASAYDTEASRTDREWTERAQLGAVGFDRVTFFAVVHDGIVGLIGGFRPDTGGSTVELVSMWTAPAARRMGVARALVAAVVGWAKDASATTVHLWVTRGNEPALHLYESMGFRQTGDSEPLPSDPTKDQLAMTLDL
ncbi:MAG TPA: GNAT family N-acetyltransferase [Acidimicrobiia bacterium]|nr:GNAT family N-acetyltransferase [Acidimicrobiia bacterium]